LIESRSFLVINVSRIGDTLLATPAIRAIRRAYPAASVSVLSHPRRAEILEHLPFIDRVGGITKRQAYWRGRWAAKRHDWALVFGFDQALVRYALRVATNVVAFRQKHADLNRRLYSAVEPPAFQSEHSVVQLLRLPAVLDIPSAGLRLAYSVSHAEHAWARARLAGDTPERASPLVGLQVASFPTKSYRDWPVESFAELAQRITDKYPHAHFLIYGGAQERARNNWLEKKLGRRATSYAGRLRLRQTAALMSATGLYVGVDTGPTHIMSAFDIPLVGLYHCYSPSRLIGALEHPCFYPVDHPRPYGCPVSTPMSEISVDAVLAQVERAFTEHPPDAGRRS
jgi:heptosyltransferase III